MEIYIDSWWVYVDESSKKITVFTHRKRQIKMHTRDYVIWKKSSVTVNDCHNIPLEWEMNIRKMKNKC